MASNPLLQVVRINVFYGRAQALHEVTFEVDAGEIVALVGRNGAGKSTLLKAVCGLQPPQSGEIRFAGESILGRRVHEIARKGVAFVPEDRQVFGNLSTAENLAIAQIAKGSQRFKAGDVYDLFPQLAAKRETLAENLSGGEQQMLTVARALLTAPELLLLDEPTEGLAPLMAEAVISALRAVNAAGMGLVIVEQNFRFTAALAARQYLLDGGRVIWTGTTAEFESGRPEIERLLLA